MFFALSKVIWTLILPGNFLALLLLGGAVLNFSACERRRRVGRRLCAVVALVFLFIGLFPVGAWLALPLENAVTASLPEKVDGVIVLGGDENPKISASRGQPVFLDSGRRYVGFAAMAKRYPQAKLAFSGGSSRLGGIEPGADAAVARDALAAMGVPVERVAFEDQSRNTYENALFSLQKVRPSKTETWVLVTSAFHMPRALLTFQAAGWNVVPYPVGYVSDGRISLRPQVSLGEHLVQMGWAAHEYYGLLAYRLMGYTFYLWPSS